MTPRKRTSLKRSSAARAGSWMALLALTTLGVDSADTLRAVVKADAPSLRASRTYRLVVQSYDAADGTLPGKGARPVASTQRSVTAAELRAGVNVNLVELREQTTGKEASGKPVIVAWVEDGEPDLEFDGRRARPQPGSVYGIVPRRASQELIEISLKHRVEA